jgi:hypothetical protein
MRHSFLYPICSNLFIKCGERESNVKAEEQVRKRENKKERKARLKHRLTENEEDLDRKINWNKHKGNREQRAVERVLRRKRDVRE